jgi:hypothetical protein
MNKQLTKKQKFAISIAVWLITTLGMFFYCLPVQHKGNLAIIETVKTLSVKEQGLLAEKNSYLQAKQALEDLAKLEIQPENFFSKNITLVKEIKKLESIASELGVEFALSGL